MSFGTSPVASAPAPVDKSKYTLFNPTPQKDLRDINALYNGPYTVDAGHVQIEHVPVLYAYDHNAGSGGNTTATFLQLGATTFRLGLLNNLDLGATIAPRLEFRSHDRMTGVTTTQRGLGDLTLRTKLNFWGDDVGSTALGLVSFLKVPINQGGVGNPYFEGGMGLPLAVELPKGWWLGVTPELHIFHDINGGNGYHLDFFSTVFFWHKIYGNLSGYVESSNWASAEHGSAWISTVDVGLTYVWGVHLQLDAGAFIGASHAANDIAPFLGVSYRF